MKSPLAIAAFGAALAATPGQSNAVLMDLGPLAPGYGHMCLLSAADQTGAWDCHPESRPENQTTAAGVLNSTRRRIDQCDGAALDFWEQVDPVSLRLYKYVTGPGANSECVMQAVEEVRRGLEEGMRFGVDCESDPSESSPGRVRVIVEE